MRTEPPLISLGQGEYRRDLYPEDLGMIAGNDTPAKIDLRFLIREPADVYHAKSRDHVTAHGLGEVRRCPALFRKKELGLVPERDTTAYVVGRAAHTLILEGRAQYEREYAVGGPINPKTGKPFGSSTKVFAEWAGRQGKPVLSDAHAALVEQMTAAVQGHLFARELFADGVADLHVALLHGNLLRVASSGPDLKRPGDAERLRVSAASAAAAVAAPVARRR